MISIRGLTVRIGERTILDGVDLEAARGEALALVGPNGSGKSTVLRSVAGLVPYSGRIEIDGRDAAHEGVAVRSRLGWMPQRPAFGDLTAREALRFAARLRGLDPGAAEAALERVGLACHGDEPARTFSGGMQQRLSLALVLHADCPVLLLDEPGASLDRQGQGLLATLVDEWRGRGRTLLFASHRPEEVSRFADRTLELEDGRLVSALPARVVRMAAARGRPCA